MTQPLLSIVTPALLHRFGDSTMYEQIQKQIKDLGTKVEYFVLLDNGPMSTGAKIDMLFKLCSGKYITLVADDDRVEDDFVDALLGAIEEHDVDLITFDHTYNVDGELVALTKQIPDCPEKHHPRGDNNYETHDRLPGPLCPVRAEIAKRFEHPNLSEKEDLAYKHFVKDNTESFYNIDRVLYHHMWTGNNKRERSGLQWIWRRL